MRLRRSDINIKMASSTIIFISIFTMGLLHACDGSRRPAHRRKDIEAEPLLAPQPTAESLQMFAQATRAAGFEDFTEGKSLVKRLIPANSQPDLDVVEYQGVIGKAGIDFPALPNIPSTGFNCKNVPTGYYADLETSCQVFHICDTSRKISFLCPNGTIFSQSHLICDWWFKVDCASAPALYESSVEYYSNEQKKSQKISHLLSKNPDLQQIGTDTNERAESRRATVNVPSTTERLLRHKQKLQTDVPFPNVKATARSYQALFDVNPTQRAQATSAFEKRRKSLVQLISNNFGNTPSRTTPTLDVTTRQTPSLTADYSSTKEMQAVAESASFVNNQNRHFLQPYHSKNIRPYAVYTPNLTPKPQKAKSTLTTLYDIQAQPNSQYVEEASTKRQTLVPYTKSYASILNEKREPYTRPGVSLLRDFLDREKNRTIYATTEQTHSVTARSDKFNKVTIETKNSFESATKIPQTNAKSTENNPLDTNTLYTSPTPSIPTTADASYQERRDKLKQKLNFETFETTGSTTPTNTDKYFQPQKLVVPSSLTPKSLHSYAIYYATALDNFSTKSPTDENEITTLAFDEYEPIDDKLPGLFSRQTINKYSNLFGQSTNGEVQENIKLDPNETYNELIEDLSLQMSQTPLATSPQIRELAQVFTHALSAYLQDPVKFRKVLSDIRPTQPSFGELVTTEEAVVTEPTTTINEDDHEILGFSDDHKDKLHDTNLRGGKALNIVPENINVEEVTSTQSTTTETPDSYSVTPQNPFRCCGRISARYTAAPTTTPSDSTNLPLNKFNVDANTEIYNSISTFIPDTPSKTKNEYADVTNVPSAWGVEYTESTAAPITNSHQMFESKKLKLTNLVPDTTPIYLPDNDSVELENEEELQRAHSQSFIKPQVNNLRHGKQITTNEKTLFKKPSEDLEAPSQPSYFETTTIEGTTQTRTTAKDQNEVSTTITPILNNVFTSPDKPFDEFQWSTPFQNWHSTIIDPITLNEGLSPAELEEGVSDITLNNGYTLSTSTNIPTDLTTANDPLISSTVNIQVTTPGTNFEDRFGKLLRDPTSTEPGQDLTTITDTVVEKAKELMVGMNATTTQKLMNVMKKTKSKTVKRLILLLVQTCDDDHNKTAEASKKALLDALMAVSQKDMEEITNEDVTETPTTSFDIKTTEYYRRSDKFVPEGRRGKSLNIEAKAVNSLSNPSTSESTTESKFEETETTTASHVRSTIPSRSRGGKRYKQRSEEPTTVTPDTPVAAARVTAQNDVKIQSDTRALELLRSLYTIAARWG